jgi:hypothetical protein
MEHSINLLAAAIEIMKKARAVQLLMGDGHLADCIVIEKAAAEEIVRSVEALLDGLKGRKERSNDDTTAGR